MQWRIEGDYLFKLIVRNGRKVLKVQSFALQFYDATEVEDGVEISHHGEKVAIIPNAAFPDELTKAELFRRFNLAHELSKPAGPRQSAKLTE